MASLELPTDLDGLIRLRLEIQSEISSIIGALAIADPLGAGFLTDDLDRALQRLASIDFAILALAPPEPIPDIPPDPRFALPDHLATDFTDLEVLNDHLATHATVITQLGDLLPQPDPIQDEGIRAQIFAIVVHFPSHNAARLALEVLPEEEVDGGLLSPVYDFLGNMWSGITGDVLAGQTSSRDFLGNLINPMSGLNSAIWDLLDDPASVLYARIDQALGDVLPDDLGEVGAGIAGLRNQLIDVVTTDIPEAISGAQEGIASFIGAGFDAFFEGSGELIGKVLGGAATAFLEALEKNFPAFGGLLFGSLLDFDELPEEIRPLIQEAAEPTSQVGALFANAATQTAVQGTVGNFLGALLAPLTFAIQRTLIPTHMDAGAAIRAGFRFPDLKETIDREIRDLGFSEGRQELLERTLRPAPSLGDIRALVNRGAITEPDALQELQEQGLLLSDANMLLALRRVLPGPSDIVRFAVREAFDPAIVTRFGLDADFPEGAVPLAERVGLSREDFLFNWRAHWELPSATQAFEMLHRDVIGPEDLDLLLRTQDVMPFWRDKVVAIAFTPFTRIDIRRFFRTNVFGPRDSPEAIAQVIRAYKDIGYDDEKAGIQAQFVEAEDLDRSFDRQLPEIRQQAKLGTLSLDAALAEIAEIAPDVSTAEETVGLLER
ncbi:hypothetical protein LCGC14_1752350, partial [marine sediment metagenome]